MNLLIDMGNTRLKWAVLQNGELKTGAPVLNAELNAGVLMQVWQALGSVERLAVSCVSANPLLDCVLETARQLWPGIKISRAVAEAQAFGMRNAYAEPEKLGVDRWLALIAARHSYPLPACVVDCGTAVTVDFLDADGNHLGGLISPGLTLMKQSLAQGTSALPYNENQLEFGLAKATEAAIYSGTLSAACGLIEHALAKHQPARLILTGGDSGLVARHLTVEATVDLDLVLRGLALTVS